LIPLTHIYMTSNTHIHDGSITWLGTYTTIISGVVRFVLLVQISLLIEVMRSCKCFARVSKIPTFTHNWVSSVVLYVVAQNAECGSLMSLKISKGK
jgi:hypothetical protein